MYIYIYMCVEVNQSLLILHHLLRSPKALSSLGHRSKRHSLRQTLHLSMTGRCLALLFHPHLFMYIFQNYRYM